MAEWYLITKKFCLKNKTSVQLRRKNMFIFRRDRDSNLCPLHSELKTDTIIINALAFAAILDVC